MVIYPQKQHHHINALSICIVMLFIIIIIVLLHPDVAHQGSLIAILSLTLWRPNPSDVHPVPFGNLDVVVGKE